MQVPHPTSLKMMTPGTEEKITQLLFIAYFQVHPKIMVVLTSWGLF